jgi:acetoacetyl-CoA synthetase
MRGTETISEELIKKIKTSIRLARSARHVPARIIEVGDIPVTLTGKKVEGRSLRVRRQSRAERSVPIRKVINGAPVQSINPATLRNPDCLAEYVKLGEEMRKAEGM